MRYYVHENGIDGWTDRQLDGQPENIMPLAMAVAGMEAEQPLVVRNTVCYYNIKQKL